MATHAQTLTVVSSRQVGRAPVRELVLEPGEGPIDFAPGQWISLRLPIGERPPLVRAYSLAEPPRRDGRVVLVFDQVDGGLGSTWLGGLASGDRVEATGALGNFVAPSPLRSDLWMVARFTGVVPVRCILRDLAESEQAQSVHLVYSAASTDDLVFDDEFRELADRVDWFSYDSLVCGNGEETAALDRLLPKDTGYRPMVCGLKSFVKPLRAYFEGRGFTRREVLCEKYD